MEFAKYGAMFRSVRLMRGDDTDLSGSIACFQNSCDCLEKLMTDPCVNGGVDRDWVSPNLEKKVVGLTAPK